MSSWLKEETIKGYGVNRGKEKHRNFAGKPARRLLGFSPRHGTHLPAFSTHTPPLTPGYAYSTNLTFHSIWDIISHYLGHLGQNGTLFGRNISIWDKLRPVGQPWVFSVSSFLPHPSFCGVHETSSDYVVQDLPIIVTHGAFGLL